MTEVKIPVEQAVHVLGRLDNVMDGVMKAGVAYVGYRSANHPGGALAALVALKLAQSGNAVAGAAGIGVLGGMGLTQVVPPSKYEGGSGYGLWWERDPTEPLIPPAKYEGGSGAGLLYERDPNVPINWFWWLS